jgi:hypothetical protein
MEPQERRSVTISPSIKDGIFEEPLSSSLEDIVPGLFVVFLVWQGRQKLQEFLSFHSCNSQ